MDQLEKNRTLRFIFSTLLAIGNFLNGSSAKGFDLMYLEKVPEVKDTVHKQSLLHHVCSIVVENFPDGTDLYSEIGAVTRSAKVTHAPLK
ncbi:FH1/FH2 domain-containing protein 3-like [Sinocyclocheilus rhinocerous]|uniref:FH1/FH2 domain-containing protein 3-like n=1 Tax=Sinocyclocheilus rhinocerous TaxID=307959 RepID=UPI0007B97A5B|nr:PREDICTED: FH1/FH2 domain-containing protein 3-like [Sinocyclocheilus rhinocerous]